MVWTPSDRREWLERLTDILQDRTFEPYPAIFLMDPMDPTTMIAT